MSSSRCRGTIEELNDSSPPRRRSRQPHAPSRPRGGWGGVWWRANQIDELAGLPMRSPESQERAGPSNPIEGFADNTGPHLISAGPISRRGLEGAHVSSLISHISDRPSIRSNVCTTDQRVRE